MPGQDESLTVVGVTGKYCSGKSTAAELLAEAGYQTIDVDRLGHEALIREQDLVLAAFGDEVKADDGSVDRKQLGRIVFSDADALARLEKILHPSMVAMTAERIDAIRSETAHDGAHPTPGIAINAAILVRMGLDSLCDTIVLVTAPFLHVLRRARARDGAGLFDVIRRLRSQRDVGPHFSSANADIYTVENDGDRERLRGQLARFLPGL
jgi:dephospho-CoA kinase